MKMDFGVFLSPEVPEYRVLEERAMVVDGLGYDSIWLSDHLLGMYTELGAPRYESWTALTALAVKTTNVRLGHLTLAVPFRNPALLAKMGATLDAVSGGRAILSIGAGWHEREFKSYGYEFGTRKSRSDQLEEAAIIIKKMLIEEKPSYNGKHYSIDEAYNSPKPVQEGGIPLMIAGEGEKRTLKTCARYGDMANYALWRGTPDDFRKKTKVLEAHCHRIDRDPGEILKSWPAFTFIDKTSEGAKGKAVDYFKNFNSDMDGGLIGDPEEMVQRIYEYADAGAGMIILSFLGPGWKEEAELFMDKVAPEFT